MGLFGKKKDDQSLRKRIVHVDHDRSGPQGAMASDNLFKKSPSVSHLHNLHPGPENRDSFYAFEDYQYTRHIPPTNSYGNYDSPTAPSFDGGAHPPRTAPLPPTSRGQPPHPPTARPGYYESSPQLGQADPLSNEFHQVQNYLNQPPVGRTYSEPMAMGETAHPSHASKPAGRRQYPPAPPSAQTRTARNPPKPTEMHTAVTPLTETLRPLAATATRQQSGAETSQMAAEGEEVVKQAIHYHEQGELEKATVYFRKAAELQNPLGMFLFGMSLRHGWGCKANPNLAFQFLQKAAESAVFDLNHLNPGTSSAAKSELSIAIYELGISFRHGWGVPKNKETAAYYFEIAANLGDADAQADLAFCYEHGNGVKKDKAKSAKYYRLAHAQGVHIFGNSWVFKSKYDNVE